MTAQTTQSAATSASSTGSVAQACPPWRALLLAQTRTTADEGPVRFCDAEAEDLAHTAASPAAQFLIANLELEFQLTHRKLSPLRISNRKYSPLLRLRFSSPSRSMSANESSDTRHSSLCVLIHGSAIKSRRKPFENSNLQISNQQQTESKMRSQNSKNPAGCRRYKGAKLGVPGEDAARPPGSATPSHDTSSGVNFSADLNFYSEFKNAIRSDISSCVRFIWKRWL
jgi:hypothetical protein